MICNARRLAALSLYIHHSWANVFPRQTATANASTPVTTASPAGITASPSICCWIVAQPQGVLVNTWWTSIVTQYTATVVTTLLQYPDTLVTANHTTKYPPPNVTAVAYGEYGQGGGTLSIPTIPGVPTDLIWADLVTGDGNYAATTVVPVDQTVVSFDFTDLQITSPTPYALWGYFAVYTSTQVAEASTCGIASEVSYYTYTSNSWTYAGVTMNVPFDNYVGGALIGGNAMGFDLEDQFVQPLAIPLPNEDVFVQVPTNLVSWLATDKKLTTKYPWITGCITLQGEGQPTVHVPVAQLTTDMTNIITLNVPLSPTSAVPSPTSTPTSQPAPDPDSLSPSASGPPGNSPTGGDSGLNPAANPPPPSGTNSATQGQQPGNGSSSPTTNDPGSPNPAGSPSLTASPAVAGGATPAPNAAQPQPQQTITLGGQPFTAVAAGSTQVIVGGQTITLPASPIAGDGGSGSGSPATQTITLDGQTYTAVATGPSQVVIGGQTLTVAGAPAAAQQTTVTLAGQVYTVGAAAGTSAVVVDGQTLAAGSAVVVGGETLSLAGSELVGVSGSATATQGLGAAILSGLGGPSTSGFSGSGSAAAATGAAGKVRPALGLSVVALGAVGFFARVA